MKIIIAGCGKVGQALAMTLTDSGHEVTVIDKNQEAMLTVTNSADVIGYQGDCTSITTQLEAGVKKADLLIAVAGDDEINMLACLIARKTGHTHTIARIRRPQYTDEISYIREELGLSMTINPERVAAAEMARLIQIPSALEVDTFAKGRVSLIGIRIPENSVLDNLQIKNLSRKVTSNALICVTEHNGRIIIPNGDTVLASGDKISVTLPLPDVSDFLNKIGIHAKKIKNVMIAGGGTTGFYLAERLISHKINVKIIEKDPERCEELAGLLPKAMIICGDATEKNLLLQESADSMDAVCCLMHQDEANILLSLFLDKLNTKIKVITRVHRNPAPMP